MTVQREDVREAVADLHDRGKHYIKSDDVVRALGLDVDDRGTRKSAGKRLSQLADEGVVERWSSKQASRATTWRIVGDEDDGPEIRADGGRDHDLDALADAIERVLIADEGYDNRLRAGPYVVSERVLSRSGTTIRQVVVNYDGAHDWLVLPKGLAETVVESIEDRDGDPEVRADGGLPPLTYGTCDCGGVHVLDHSTVDGPAVRFPCDAEDCDWVKTIARGVLEDELAEADADIDLDDYAKDGEVPA